MQSVRRGLRQSRRLGVVDFDLETGEATSVCVYCVTGMDHPDDPDLPADPPLGTLHQRGYGWRALPRKHVTRALVPTASP